MQFMWHHLFWLWLSVVLIGASGLDLLWYGVVVLRASDVDYDPKRCAERRPRVDLKKALRRRASWPALGLPLWLVAVVLFGVQLLWWSLTAYAVISIAWFVTAPLRKIWGMAIARRVHTRTQGTKPDTSLWYDVAYYYSWGFELPQRPEEQEWFVGKYRWLNNFQKLWYVIQVWRFWGLPALAIASLVWPVTAVCAIFYHLDNVDDYSYMRPWWRFDQHSDQPKKPHQGKVVDGEVVTPATGTAPTVGSAAVARSKRSYPAPDLPDPGRTTYTG
ncbi:MAG TPA: hypothetical protein VLF67_02715 [Candidatus Saccharimonas sp.]|nr:hypothetical protein [Candidatus Saccharimonas sp.]